MLLFCESFTGRQGKVGYGYLLFITLQTVFILSHFIEGSVFIFIAQ